MAVPINKELTETMSAWLRSIADTIDKRGIVMIADCSLEYDEIEVPNEENNGIRAFVAGNNVELRMGWTFGKEPK